MLGWAGQEVLDERAILVQDRLQALAGDDIPEGGWRAAEVKWPLPE